MLRGMSNGESLNWADGSWLHVSHDDDQVVFQWCGADLGRGTFAVPERNAPELARMILAAYQRDGRAPRSVPAAEQVRIKQLPTF